MAQNNNRQSSSRRGLRNKQNVHESIKLSGIQLPVSSSESSRNFNDSCYSNDSTRSFYTDYDDCVIGGGDSRGRSKMLHSKKGVGLDIHNDVSGRDLREPTLTTSSRNLTANTGLSQRGLSSRRGLPSKGYAEKKMKQSVSLATALSSRVLNAGSPPLSPQKKLSTNNSRRGFESPKSESSPNARNHRNNASTNSLPPDLISLTESFSSFSVDPFYSTESPYEEMPSQRESEILTMAEVAAEARESVRSFGAIGGRSHHSQDSTEQMELEVSPGVFLPFRGAKETRVALANNLALESKCLDCAIKLISVSDCEYVVCPDCNMVNPIFDRPASITNILGVGMGFKKDWMDN